METVSPGMTDRERGVWVSTTSPLDPSKISPKKSVEVSWFKICPITAGLRLPFYLFILLSVFAFFDLVFLKKKILLGFLPAF